jgi:hypothetical protein
MVKYKLKSTYYPYPIISYHIAHPMKCYHDSRMSHFCFLLVDKVESCIYLFLNGLAGING